MDIQSAYKKLKADYPEAYTALAVLPVSGQALAIADYADAMRDDDSTGMALAAASLIPGVKLAKYGAKLGHVALSPPSLRVGMNSAERSIAPIVKNSDKIGKGMGAQQVGEYAQKKVSEPAKPVNQAAIDQEEYTSAWSAHP